MSAVGSPITDSVMQVLKQINLTSQVINVMSAPENSQQNKNKHVKSSYKQCSQQPKRQVCYPHYASVPL